MGKRSQMGSTSRSKAGAASRAGRARALPEANRVLLLGLVVYLAILAGMVAFDSYAFVLKSTVIPFLLLAALLSLRLQSFVNDWAPFLGAVVLFDSLRSLEYAATTYFQMPMYAVYAIDWDRWLCGGAISTVSAQQWRASLADPYWLDRLFVLMHASHFLFFLLFGFLLWYLRREVFRTYAAAMTALLYLALLLHVLVPTLPPWMAARDFALLPPIERLIGSVYNAKLPSLFAMFDVNPIAAMPSLHAAMPTLCAFVALRYIGWRGLVVWLYAAAVGIGVIYLGEHYAVDVLAGLALAAVVYVGVRRFGAPPTLLAEPATPGSSEQLASRPIVAGVSLVAVAFLLGSLATALLSPLPITVAFVERELVGRSPAASYLLGRIAFDEGDFVTASTRFAEALEQMPGAEAQRVIRDFLRRSEQRAASVQRASRLPGGNRR